MSMDERNGERPWGELYADILLRILSFLPFMDHLSFRAVCTFWRAAAQLAEAEDQPQDQRPWLIFTEEGGSSGDPTFKKRILDPATRRLYTLEWPREMMILEEGARCVASGHGWLLYHSPRSSRIFFFNPFSRATIDLPYIESIFPASFENDPTGDECVVIGIYSCLPNEVIICYCGRGDGYWNLSRCKTEWPWGNFTHAVSCNHLFCFMDARGRLLVFNFLRFTVVECGGPPLNFDSFRVAYLVVADWRVYAAFVDIVHTGAVCVFVMQAGGMWEWLLDGNLNDQVFYLGRTASLAYDATLDDRSLIYFDTLVTDGSTCPALTGGLLTPLSDFGGFRNHSLCTDAVWIQPRWINPSPKHDWLRVQYRFGDEGLAGGPQEQQQAHEEEEEEQAHEEEENKLTKKKVKEEN